MIFLKIRGIAHSLSFRRLLYILKRNSLNSSEGIYNAVNRAAMSRFLPPVTKVAFEKALSDIGIKPDAKESSDSIDHGNIFFVRVFLKFKFRMERTINSCARVGY